MVSILASNCHEISMLAFRSGNASHLINFIQNRKMSHELPYNQAKKQTLCPIAVTNASVGQWMSKVRAGWLRIKDIVHKEKTDKIHEKSSSLDFPFPHIAHIKWNAPIILFCIGLYAFYEHVLKHMLHRYLYFKNSHILWTANALLYKHTCDLGQ